MDTGLATLEALAETPNLNRWYYEELRDGVSGRVLEVGAGIGNMSALFERDASDLVVSEVEADYLERLSARFAGNERVSVVPYDLDAPPPPELGGGFDTVVSLNVIEHLEDDRRAVERLAELLSPGGRLLTYVPACDWTYGTLDLGLLHYRRYSTQTFGRLMESAGLRVERMKYINLVGAFGWFVNSRVLQRTTLSPTQAQVFDKLIPVVRAIEEGRTLPFGLGLICYARKAA